MRLLRGRCVGIWMLSAFILSSCQRNSGGFVIDGQVDGFADGEVLYLFDNTTNTLIDSAFVMNGRFSLKGKVASPAMWVLLRTWNFTDFKFFWLENAPVAFKGDKGNFRFAEITGSATQSLFHSLELAEAPYQKKFDSLFEINDHDLTPAERSARSLQMDWYQMKLKVCAMDYIRGNPGSISSAFLLNLYKVGWGKTLTAEFYDAFSQEVKDTKYGRHIGEYLEVNKNPQVGDKVVDFSLPNPEGRLVSVGDYKGKVLLIEFWSSRCGPCRVENPRLVELYQKFRGSGFEILGVGLEDDRDAWLKAIETDGIPWENVSDLKADENVAAMVYGVSAIPDNVLVDRNGLIIERRISVQELKTQLETLLTKHSEMHERIFRK